MYTTELRHCLNCLIIGISAAVKRLANFELKELLEPALYFAENGFKLPNLLGALIAAYYNDITLLRTEDGEYKIYCRLVIL